MNRIPRYPAYAALLILLVGCAQLSLEQQADQLHGSFVVAKEQIVKVTRDPLVTDDVKRKLATAAIAADPLANDLYGLLLQLDAVKKGIADGTATLEDLDRLNAQLAQLILTARGPIEFLSQSVEGAR